MRGDCEEQLQRAIRQTSWIDGLLLAVVGFLGSGAVAATLVYLVIATGSLEPLWQPFSLVGLGLAALGVAGLRMHRGAKRS